MTEVSFIFMLICPTFVTFTANTNNNMTYAVNNIQIVMVSLNPVFVDVIFYFSYNLFILLIIVFIHKSLTLSNQCPIKPNILFKIETCSIQS